MVISRISIERPVFAIVISLLLMVFGIGAMLLLPVREYPDIDPPVVSVFTVYPGASAAVVDREVTETIEEAISTIEGIDTITASSRQGVSQMTIEFVLDRNLEAAAADVRDKIGQVRAELPDQVEDPIVTKASADADPIMWLTLTSATRDRLELTDYADRQLVDPLSIVPGVAQVIIGGARRYAMRIWLDQEAMVARGVTVNDVTERLREQNVELPAGRLESARREFTVRATTRLSTPQEFRDLILRQADGYQVTLGQVARVEIGAESYRSAVRIGQEPAVGLGVVRQSEANTLRVAQGIRQEIERLQSRLPEDIELAVGFDSSVFIEGSIREVIKTLAITVTLVITVIFLFLGSFKSTIIPATTIPVSLLAAFTVLYGFGFSINTLTLLALVLAIGLVVDDAIVVLENIFRRNEQGEPRLLAAARGADQIGFAVISTTLVLVSVFIPLTFLRGDVGRLFTEFATALAACVVFSSLVALSLGAMISSKLVNADQQTAGRFFLFTRRVFDALAHGYRQVLERLMGFPLVVVVIALIASGAVYWFYTILPKELAPVEDRGTIIVPIEAPQGASFEYTMDYLMQIEDLLASLAGEEGPVDRIVSIVGLAQQGPAPVNEGLLIVQLKAWQAREKSQQQIVQSLLPRLLEIPGVDAFAVNPPSFGQEGFRQPVQFVIGGPDYDTAQQWAKQLLAEAKQWPGLVNPRLDYKETKPQTEISIDREKAADLGVDVRQVGETLQIMLGEQDVTDYIYKSQTYEVIPRAEAEDRITPEALKNLYVRASNGDLVSLRGIVDVRLVGAPNELRRVNRSASVTLSASLAPDTALGDALAKLEDIVKRELPPDVRIEYLGRSKEYQQSSRGVFIAFALALVIVFLVLAAQFESFVHPMVIMLPVPLAITGGLMALVLFDRSFNIYSQIALILLIGIMAKNAILVVEFANQIRDRGAKVRAAVVEAAVARLRPILMTSIGTTFGAVPLALASGPGAEGRTVIGIVVIGGTLFATLLTLFVVPGLYVLLARFTTPMSVVKKKLEQLETEHETP